MQAERSGEDGDGKRVTAEASHGVDSREHGGLWDEGESRPFTEHQGVLFTEEALPEVSSLPPAIVKVSPSPLWPEAVTTPPPLLVTHGPQFLLPGVVWPTACGLQEARCHSGHCIPKDYLCDGQEDCKDGSDELDCGECCAGQERRN